MRAGMLTLAIILNCVYTDLKAQVKPDTVGNFKVKVPVRQRMYVGNGLDFAMLSVSFNSRPGRSSYMTVPRFTAMVNFGFSFHYDISEKFGLMSGLGIRNMGYIDKEAGRTVKRRVYSLGIPLGIKFGDLRNRNFVFLGGGIDLPFNYREKSFTKRSEKAKFSDWFGDQTPRVLPFVFLGHSWDPGITLKFQYYPVNFMNEDYSGAATSIPPNKPYNGYNVKLLLLSLGIDIHYGQYKRDERDYQDLKKTREERKLL